MQELFRIVNGRMEAEASQFLEQYNMHICEGEIVYVQGLQESGVHRLIDFFSCRKPLQDGWIFLREHRLDVMTKEKAREAGIYTITAEADLVKELSVAENLEVIRWVPFPFRFFNRRKIEREVDEYLEKEKAALSGRDLLVGLDSSECQNLSILKAKMHGVSLIVLDCTRGNYEGKKGEKLCGLIKRLSGEGIAFLILSERYLPLAETADRIQVIYRGRDLMEWHGLSEKLKEDLIHFNRISVSERGKDGHHESLLCGIFDYEWEIEKGFLCYLKQFYTESPVLWRRMAGMDCVPGKYGMEGKLVILPRKYMDVHFDTMEIRDNIIMTIPGRIAHGGKYGVVDHHFKKLVTEKFYEVAEVPWKVTSVGELDRAQRRILSFFRWEVARPKVMFLDCPYIGLGQEEAVRVRGYLESLAGEGIRVIYFSQLAEELREDCHEIFTSHDGKGHQRTEFSTW